MRRRTFALPFWLSLALPGSADERTGRMLKALADEAANFERIAINLISEETLIQTAYTGAKSKRKTEASGPLPQGWVQREIRSEYVFASLGDPAGIREVRKATHVDGKPVRDADRAVQQLVQTVRSGSDRSRRRLLEDFEQHGLRGTVTDLGQLLLLFGPKGQQRYSFTYSGERYLGAQLCELFQYQQLDGQGALTVFDEKGTAQPRISGEIWVARGTYRLVRLTLKSGRKEQGDDVREEALVDYLRSPHGILVPSFVVHHQYRDGSLAAENRFTYGEFRKFGSSAILKYSTVQP